MKRLKEKIKKTRNKNEWCVFSEAGKSLGCFPSLKQAKKRLSQVEFFKRHKEDVFAEIVEGSLEDALHVLLTVDYSLTDEQADDVISAGINKDAVEGTMRGLDVAPKLIASYLEVISGFAWRLKFDSAEEQITRALAEAKKWTKVGAKAWLKKNDFKSGNVEKRKNFWSFRQTDPGKYKSFAQQDKGKGIVFVLGILGPGKSEVQSVRFFHGQGKTEEAVEGTFSDEFGITLLEEKEEGLVWEIVVINEGKSKNSTVYTDPAMEDMQGIIAEAEAEGSPTRCMAYDFEECIDLLSHLSQEQRELFPEGFPKKTLGWFKNPEIVESRLHADLHISEHAAWLMEAFKSAKRHNIPKPFGLSIDGKGEVEEAHDGTEPVYNINHVTSLSEVTVVTYPSAGGEIIDVKEADSLLVLIESYDNRRKNMNYLVMIAKLLERVLGIEIMEGLKPEDATLETVKEALSKAIEKDARFANCGEITEESAQSVLLELGRIENQIDLQKSMDATKKEILDAMEGRAHDVETGKKPDRGVKEGEKPDKPDSELQEALKAMREETRKNRIAMNQSTVESKLKDSKLTESFKNIIRKRYVAAEELDVADLSETILEYEKACAAAHGGDERLPVHVTEAEKTKQASALQRDFDIMMEVPDEDGNIRPMNEGRFKGPGSLWVAMTGDKNFDLNVGRSGQSRLHEAIAISDYSTMLGTSMTKHMVSEFDMGNKDWMKLCTIRPLADFKQQDIVQMGQFDDLDLVAENAAYTAFNTPTEVTGSYTPAKYGNIIALSRESLITDDLRQFSTFPKRIGFSANRTVAKFVFDLLLSYTAAINDTNIYDGTVLYTGTGAHANIVTDALDQSSFRTAVNLMWNQQDPDNQDVYGIEPKYLVIPKALQAAAKVIIESKFVNGSPNNDINPEFGGVDEILVSPYLRSDLNNWYLAADPRMWSAIEVGFVQGQVKPVLLQQNVETTGTVFTNDQITWKTRYQYGGMVTDFRPVVGGIVA